MRSTSILYGIKGIFPIIKKECPQAIHYPTRYASLKGYRIAIDATLLVQRFHFSEDEHPARHVIGFYRLISALRAADVYPIFVFDHLQSRLTAKSRETEKRREARGKVRQRMKLEMRRAWRLRMLSEGLKRILGLDDEEKLRVGKLLRSWAELGDDEGEQPAYQEVLGGVADSDTLRDWSAFRLRLDELMETSTSKVQDGLPLEESVSSPLNLVDTPEHEDHSTWQIIQEDQTSSVHAIAMQIDALRRDFRQNHPRGIVAQEEAQTVGEVPPGPSTSADGQSASASPPVPSQPTATPQTATQLKMNDIEEQLYSSLMGGLDFEPRLTKADDAAWKAVQAKMDSSIEDAALDTSEDAPRMTLNQTAFETITSHNETLQKSYKRSTAPLSSTIFDDCATLCTLLKAPVLWTGSGSPYGGAKGEAEALAASLVSEGYADAVATEDSDVLLAEVPLLRHFTGTKKPMELIDSLSVRRALFPTKSDSTRDDRLSRYSMLELALLCGTDFNRTIPGLAGRGALRLLREYGTIRGILRSYPAAGKKYRPPDGLSWKEFGVELTRARSVFVRPPDARSALRLNGLRGWDEVERHERRKKVGRRKKGKAADAAVDSVEDLAVEESDSIASEEEVDSAVAVDQIDSAATSDEELTFEHAESGADGVEESSRDTAGTAASTEQAETTEGPHLDGPTTPTPTPTLPPSLEAMANAIPTEDNSTTLADEEALQSDREQDLSTRLPPPPSISLLDSLSLSSPSTSRTFPLAEYDRFALRAFLRSKGLGKGREVQSESESWREREMTWQSGLRFDDGVQRVEEDTPHQMQTRGFGESAFGDSDTAALRFEWEKR